MLSVDEAARRLNLSPGRVRWYVTFLETEGVLPPRISSAQPIRLRERDLAVLHEFVEELNRGREPEEAAANLRKRAFVAGRQEKSVEEVSFVPPLPEVRIPDEFDSRALRELAHALQALVRYHIPQLYVAIQSVEESVAERLDRLAEEIRVQLAGQDNGPLF